MKLGNYMTAAINMLGGPVKDLVEEYLVTTHTESYRTAPLSLAVGQPGELKCLALTIYFEARGESDAGKRAVGNVVMNRVLDDAFPNTVCRVVQQGGEMAGNRCQFSWWCDGRSDSPKDAAAWEDSYQVALNAYWDRSRDPTDGALWYHADYVKPKWRTAFALGAKIGRHYFYRRPDRAVPVALRSLVDRPWPM